MDPASSAHRPRVRRLRLLLAAMISAGCVYGCADLFNPSFLQLFTPIDDPEAGFAALEPPIGHVPIIFRNNANIADNVFRYVVQRDSIVREEVVDEILRENPQLTREEAEQLIQAIIDDQPVQLEEVRLPPRIRLTVVVTNVDGGTQTLEFLDGLRIVREENENENFGGGELPPDLNENTNNTFIAQCEIAQIQVVAVEAFIPVVIKVTDPLVNEEGFPIGEECREFNIPQFRILLPDEGLTNDQFTLTRNFDPRFFPPPLQDLRCGAVVVLELTGSLSLPFTSGEDCEPEFNPPASGLVPGYDRVDIEAQAQVPGRYGLSVSIRDQ